MDAGRESELLLDEYISWFRDVRMSRPSSVKQYRAVLSKFVAVVPDVRTATASDIECFLRRERQHRGQVMEVGSAATILRDRTMISGFYRYLSSRGVRRDNPVELTGAPTLHNRDPRAVDDATWVQLWSSRLTGEDRVFLGLMGFVGLRRMEIIQVSAAHFDPVRGRLLCPDRKGGKEMAVEYLDMVHVIADCLSHLLPDRRQFIDPLEWLLGLRREDDFLMSWMRPDVDASIVNRQLQRVLSHAGMSGAFTPHALRHTAATNLVRAGVPIEIVADQLGHANMETTRRYLRSGGMLARWRATEPRERRLK